MYGAQEGVLSENSKLNPLSLYAKTKLNAENFLKDKIAVFLGLEHYLVLETPTLE